MNGIGFGHQKGFVSFARFANDGVFDEGVAKIDLGGEGDFSLERVKGDFANLKFSGTDGLDEVLGFLEFFCGGKCQRIRASGLRRKQESNGQGKESHIFCPLRILAVWDGMASSPTGLGAPDAEGYTVAWGVFCVLFWSGL